MLYVMRDNIIWEYYVLAYASLMIIESVETTRSCLNILKYAPLYNGEIVSKF